MTSLEAPSADATAAAAVSALTLRTCPVVWNRAVPFPSPQDFGGDRGNHRDPAGVEDVHDTRGIDAHHFADEAQVHFFAVHDGAGADGPQQAAVLAGHAHGVGAVGVDEAHEFAAHLPGEHHADHVHGLGGGDAQAALEFGLDAQPAEHGVDLRAAAVHHDGVDAHVVQEHDVLGEGTAEFLVDHGVAAVLDHHGGAGEALDPRQRLDQRAGFVLGSRSSDVTFSRVWVFMLLLQVSWRL